MKRKIRGKELFSVKMIVFQIKSLLFRRKSVILQSVSCSDYASNKLYYN